jgi:hypothetical protein
MAQVVLVEQVYPVAGYFMAVAGAHTELISILLKQPIG